MTHLILIFNLLSDYDVGKHADFTLVKRGFGGDLYKPTIGNKIVETLYSNRVTSET